MARHRSGHSAAMTFAVRAPQSKPATIAWSTPSASSSAIASTASTACCPLRTASPERNRVGPYPRRYGTITRYPAAASAGAASA